MHQLPELNLLKKDTTSWCLSRDYSPLEWAALLICYRRLGDLPNWAHVAATSNCCCNLRNVFQSLRMGGWGRGATIESEMSCKELHFYVQYLTQPAPGGMIFCYMLLPTNVSYRDPSTFQRHSFHTDSFRQSSTVTLHQPLWYLHDSATGS